MDEEHSAQEEESLPRPTGTLFVMTVYLAVLAGMWAVMYWMLIAR
jgi:Cytochrome c oxidase subunit IIa family